jgi:hypothetical protein
MTNITLREFETQLNEAEGHRELTAVWEPTHAE